MRPDWLQGIPSSWGSVPFGSIFTQSKRKNSRLQRDFVLSVIKDRGVIPYTEKGNVGNKVSDDLSGYKLVDRGDFVLNSMNLYMGSVGVSEYEGVTSTAYIVCKPSGDVFAGYYNYLIQFKGFQEYVGLLGKGIMEIREAVRWTALKSVFVPLPDLPTQRAIADFLDRETARIDLLIEKKQRLVALLGEKQSATITAAVTGQTEVAGAGSRDCHLAEGGGVVRLQLRRVVSLGNTKTQFDESLRPYIGLEHIASWTGDIMGSDDTEPEGIVAHFSKGDILFGKLRPYLAKVASPDFKGVCSTEVLVLRPGKRMERRFLRYTLASSVFIDRVNAATYGAKMPRANWENIGTEIIWAPDLTTQRAIADFLDNETVRLQQIQETTQQSINRLREYRSALITAAVTGQIDVAEWGKAGAEERRLDAVKAEMKH